MLVALTKMASNIELSQIQPPYPPTTSKGTLGRDLAQLNTARNEASACTLAGKVYVFGGQHGEVSINSIETIYEISLFSQSTAHWQLIEMS